MYDPEELAIGTQVETEHTSDLDEAERIAKDHLREDPRYYTKLVAMEAGLREPPAGFTLWPGSWTEGTTLQAAAEGPTAGFFHVTTRGSSVAAKGLLSRKRAGVVALGGGARDEAPDMVSFHVNRGSAEWMRDVFVVMARVCRGEMSAAECVEAVLDWTQFPEGFLDALPEDFDEEEAEEFPGVTPDDVKSLVHEVIGLEQFADPYDRKAFQRALEREAEHLDELYPTARDRYVLMADLETRLNSTFYERWSEDERSCEPFIGFTANFKDFCQIDPGEVAVVRAAVRKGAEEWIVAEECEIRFSPDDIVVVGVKTWDGRLLANRGRRR